MILGHRVIGIIGSRKRDSEEDLRQVGKKFEELTTTGSWIICSGGCSRGGDRFAQLISSFKDIPIIVFPAEWGRYGKRAGPIRNNLIAEASDILLACVVPESIYKGGKYFSGTEDTITKFIRQGKGENNVFLV